MKIISIIAASIVMSGCAGAIISSQVRESGEPGSQKMTRCIDTKTGSFAKKNDELAKYDGWKMVYVSEYTTPNKSTSAVVMCFEKPTSK